MTIDTFEAELTAFLESVNNVFTFEQAFAYIEHSARFDLEDQHHEQLEFGLIWGDINSDDTSSPAENSAHDIYELYLIRGFACVDGVDWRLADIVFSFGFPATDELRTLHASDYVGRIYKEFSSAQDREIRDQKRRAFIERVKGVTRLWSAVQNLKPIYSRGEFFIE